MWPFFPPALSPNPLKSPATSTPLLSDLAGLQGQRWTVRPMPRQQCPADHMQVVAHHPVTHIPSVAFHPSLRAAVQPVMLKAVALALHRAVLPPQSRKALPAFPLRLRRLFCEQLASRRGDARIDLLERRVVQQGDIVAQGLAGEGLVVLAPWGGGHAEHLAHEGVIIGDMLQPVQGLSLRLKVSFGGGVGAFLRRLL